jgi:hypothetical protein
MQPDRLPQVRGRWGRLGAFSIGPPYRGGAAHDAIASELATTTIRLRAIERRWIPDHETALKALELTLAENELSDVARVRWASERQRWPGQRPSAPCAT